MDQSSVFATLGLVTCAIASLTSVLAFGLPYWVYFDETLPVTQSGTLYDVQLRYNFGFWGYCNKVTSNIGNSNTCGAANTSSDAEQTTVCLLILAVVFCVSGVINIILYLSVLRHEKLCLYLACTSELIAGILGTTSVIHFGVHDHSVTITNNLTLTFSAASLYASFWLAVGACCSVAIATVLTAIAILKHKRTDLSTDDTGSLSSLSFKAYPPNENSYDDTDVTSQGSDYPFLPSGESKRPFYAHIESDSSDEEMVFSKAPIATAMFGLKDKINWRERVKQKPDTDAHDHLQKPKDQLADETFEVQDDKINRKDAKMQRVRQEARTGKKTHRNKDRLQVEQNRRERDKTLKDVYGEPLVIIGDMGAIPAPNPLVRNRKMLPDDNSMGTQEQDGSSEEQGDMSKITDTTLDAIQLEGKSEDEDRRPPSADTTQSKHVAFQEMAPVETPSTSSMTLNISTSTADTGIGYVGQVKSDMDDATVNKTVENEDSDRIDMDQHSTDEESMDDEEHIEVTIKHMPKATTAGAKTGNRPKTAIARKGARKHQKVRPKTTTGKRKRRKNKDRIQVEKNRLERAKTLADVYGEPLVKIGAMGAIPAPNPLIRNKKMPSDDVIASGRKLMTSLQAYRKMRKELNKKQQTEPTVDEE